MTIVKTGENMYTTKDMDITLSLIVILLTDVLVKNGHSLNVMLLTVSNPTTVLIQKTLVSTVGMIFQNQLTLLVNSN